MAASSLNIDQWTGTLEKWFAKFPALPKGATDVIVKLAPWLALIFGILGVLGSLTVTGFLAVLSPFVALGGGLGMAAGGVVGGVLALVSSVLLLMAFPGLKDRKVAGWKWSFYSELISIVSSVVAFNLVGALVGALIGFYILFQVKSYYK